MNIVRTFKYNYTYQTKNMVNGKTYLGVHSTDILDDGYIGCGIYREPTKGLKKYPFQRAVAKYGYENFEKEILCFFDTAEEAYEEEIFLVDEKWVESKENYNLALGGGSGWYHVNKKDKTGKNNPFYGKKHTKETIEIIIKTHLGSKRSEETKRKMSISSTNENNAGENHPMWGKKHREDSRKAMSEGHLKRLEVEENRVKLKKSFGNAQQIQNTETGEIFTCMKDAAKDANMRYRKFIYSIRNNKTEKYRIV